MSCVGPFLQVARIALFALLATVGASAPAWARDQIGRDTPYAQPGPHEVTVERRALCCDGEGHRIDIYRPQMSRRRPLPAIVWGNGTWASPDKYDFFLRHLASWGFLVIATRDSSVASGRTMLDALDRFMEVRGDRGVRVDPQRIAAVGHSQGAGGAMNALMDAGGRIRTAIAISLPGQQYCRGADCARIPAAMPDGTSAFFLSGERDGLSPATQRRPTSPPRQSLKAYYDAVPPGLTKFRAAVRGADHNDVQGNPGCGFLAFGCRQGVDGFLGYATAWLLWQLDGDRSARALFERGPHSIHSDPALTEVEGDVVRR